MKPGRAAWGLTALLALVAAGAVGPQSHAQSSAIGVPLTQQGPKLTANDESGSGWFGFRTALSADGNTALASGIEDNNEGAVAVFTRSGSTWTQQGPKLTSPDERAGGLFGAGIALSADGNTALIGAPGDNGGFGAAWVFTRSGSIWTQQGPTLLPDDEVGRGCFGGSAALSADGNTALLGGSCDGNYVGASWVFTRSGSTWTQQGPKLAASDEAGQGGFGIGALSADGGTALIGAPADNGNIGAAWMFTRSGATWSQHGAKVTPDDETGPGYFGEAVALSTDGSTALISGVYDNGGAGAAWAFTRSGPVLTQEGPKLVPDDQVGGGFGTQVALSANGDEAVVSSDTDNGNVGAAWEFARSGTVWTQVGSKLTASDETGTGYFGSGVALSADGNTAVLGGFGDSDFAGAAWAFTLALPTSADQCKKGGWQSFAVFKNQGDCVSYVATHGKNPPG